MLFTYKKLTFLATWGQTRHWIFHCDLLWKKLGSDNRSSCQVASIKSSGMSQTAAAYEDPATRQCFTSTNSEKHRVLRHSYVVFHISLVTSRLRLQPAAWGIALVSKHPSCWGFLVFPPYFPPSALQLRSQAKCRMNEQYLAAAAAGSSPDWRFHYIQTAYICSLNSRQSANNRITN